MDDEISQLGKDLRAIHEEIMQEQAMGDNDEITITLRKETWEIVERVLAKEWSSLGNGFVYPSLDEGIKLLKSHIFYAKNVIRNELANHEEVKE